MSLAIALSLLVLYLGAVYWLSWIGMRKTTSLASFAIGNGDMGPITVGVVMAASIASTATFVINPGFVYSHGLSALLHYGVAAQAGVAVGLFAVCRGFRRVGTAHGVLTVPDWIRARYGSERLATVFALLNLLSIAFVVLIMVGCAYLVVALLGISYPLALGGTLVVVFSYVLLGGTYAHAYTNLVQSAMMVVVALVLFGSGLHHFDGGLFSAMAEVSSDWAAPVNPTSSLYASMFSVFVSAFLVTFALMLQPHILTKVLYLRHEGEIRRFILTAVAIGCIFSLCLFVGVYAKLDGMDLPAAQQDRVVTEYVMTAFGDGIGADIVSSIMLVTLLAAGMSTLDGILVALSAMVVHDLVLRGRKRDADASVGLKASRLALVGVGVVSFLLALDPPELVGLFAQKGVYGLAAASFSPIVLGVLVRGAIAPWVPTLAAVVALVVHFSLQASGVENPAASSSWAILVSMTVASAALVWSRRGARG
jgi:SSS family solute:Na+ symporter/sodium/pantothenate symporter